MHEKEVGKDLIGIMFFISFIATLAKCLSDMGNREKPFRWKILFVELFVGTVSGVLFGLLGCWLIGQYQAVVGAFAGFGAILSIHGVARIATALEEFIIKKLK